MTQTTLAAIEALHDTVVIAWILAANGRQIDLSGLDVEAAGLCATVQQMPRHRAKLLCPALEALAREVEGLAALPPP